jgi:glutamate synthase domain-containing protein 3
MVELEAVEDDDDKAELKQLIENHLGYTGSAVAKRVLDDWDKLLKQFIKVMPTDYKRVLMEQRDLQSVAG